MKYPAHWLNSGILILLLVFLSRAEGQATKNKVGRAEPSRSPQARFISGRNSLDIPIELASDLVLLQVGVNDSVPLWFIFDTGAESTVIDSELAKKLGLKAGGKIVGSGGAGTAQATRYEAVSMRLPNVEMNDMAVYGLPLDSFSPALGRKISGIIGYDFIKEFVVEIDYSGRKISLYKPENYSYSGKGETFPLTFEENMPFIRASVLLKGRAPVAGKFEIDSGSTGALLLNTPFVNKHQFRRSVAATSQIRISGVGGTAKAFIARIKGIGFGSFTLGNPIVRFSQSTRGDYASTKYDGLIGGEILRRFKTTFDYSHRRMVLDPNAQFSEPYETDMSGMELVADGDDFSIVLVDDVEPNSPATEAGIQGGDTISAIDGHPVINFTLEQIRRMFRDDKREYALSLVRGGTAVQAKLKLRRLE